jgi:hypothetical protein
VTDDKDDFIGVKNPENKIASALVDAMNKGVHVFIVLPLYPDPSKEEG